MTEPSVDAIAAAVEAVPDVCRLSGGTVGEFATYLPGRRVEGVQITDHSVDIHIDVRLAQPAPAIADAVRTALRPLVGGRRVDVTIADVELSSPTLEDPP